MPTKGHAPAQQTRYRVPLQGAGKQKGMAKRVEELERKQLDAMQARVVAAEKKTKDKEKGLSGRDNDRRDSWKSGETRCTRDE